jgi:DNA-binding transcriptional LysR family regulator
MSQKAADLNLYRVFDAIYSEGSLTRAGEILHVTQPAVSNALSRLRQEYDDPLFVRSGKRMQATPMAEAMAPDIRRALKLLANTRLGAGHFDPATSTRRFRLRLSDLLEAMLIPALLNRIQQTAPAVSLETFQASRRTLSRDLSSGEADLAMDAILHSDPQLHHALLCRDRYVCMVRPGHPVEGKTLDLQAYLDLQHVMPSSRRRGLGFVDLALKRLGLQRRILLRSQHYLLTPQVVACTDLALSAPASLGALQGLSCMELPFEVAPLDIRMFWHRRVESDPAVTWLRGQVQEVAALSIPGS